MNCFSTHLRSPGIEGGMETEGKPMTTPEVLNITRGTWRTLIDV